MYVLILAGGGGTRLWPLSRRARPKPFLPLLGEESLFQLTLRRIEPLVPAEDIYVVADERNREVVADQAPQLGGTHLLGEPFARNTAAAVALAALTVSRVDDDVMIVLPADHYIADPSGFRVLLSVAAEAARDGSLVVLGITPTGPETGFGYVIGADADESESKVRRVAQFVEKPERDRARELLSARHGAWWNAGIFIWRRDAVLDGLERHASGLVSTLRRGLEAGEPLAAIYERLPAVSIDRALLEPASLEGRVRAVPADVGWSDLGSWNALQAALAQRLQSADGVVTVGRAEDVGSHDVLVHSSAGRLVVTVGLSDTIVVDTPDVVLVCAADRAQEVRTIVDRLAQAKETDHL